MDCETFKATLIDRGTDQATAQPDDPFAAHARHCSECRDAACEHTSLLSLVRGLADLEPGSQILARLCATARAGPRQRPQPLCSTSSSQPRRRHRLRLGVIALLPLPFAGLTQTTALAASLMLGIGLSLLVSPPAGFPVPGAAPGANAAHAANAAPPSPRTRAQVAPPGPATSDLQVTPSPIDAAHSQCSFVPPL
jgi:hypothetical protein